MQNSIYFSFLCEIKQYMKCNKQPSKQTRIKWFQLRIATEALVLQPQRHRWEMVYMASTEEKHCKRGKRMGRLKERSEMPHNLYSEPHFCRRAPKNIKDTNIILKRQISRIHLQAIEEERDVYHRSPQTEKRYFQWFFNKSSSSEKGSFWFSRLQYLAKLGKRGGGGISLTRRERKRKPWTFKVVCEKGVLQF